MWYRWWNENWQGKEKYLEKTYPSDTLSDTVSRMFWSGIELGLAEVGIRLLTSLAMAWAVSIFRSSCGCCIVCFSYVAVSKCLLLFSSRVSFWGFTLEHNICRAYCRKGCCFEIPHSSRLHGYTFTLQYFFFCFFVYRVSTGWRDDVDKSHCFISLSLTNVAPIFTINLQYLLLL
jgi:hypothetical protein